MQRIAESLVQQAYVVSIIGRNLGRDYKSDNQGFTIKRIKCWFNRGFLFYKEFNIRLLIQLLFGKRYDIVCACDTDTLAGAGLAARLRGSKFVYDAHEWFTEVPELEGKPIKKKLWSLIEHLYIPLTHARYTVNESLAGIFQQKFNRHFEVIRNLPLATLSKGVVKIQPPVILYQGALNKGRGIEEAIIAMKDLSGVQLWIAGEGDLSDDLRALSRSLKLESRIRFLGYVNPVDLQELTPKCFIGLNMLQASSANYYYSLANKFFDYLQAGVPSINMRFPEYERLNEQYACSILLDHCTSEEFVEVIHTLMDDPDRYESLSKACFRASSELKWENEIDKLYAIYDAL